MIGSVHLKVMLKSFSCVFVVFFFIYMYLLEMDVIMCEKALI